MARIPNRGTPDKSKKYVFPSGAGWRLFILSLLGAAAVLVGAALLHTVGVKSVADPGPLTSGHAKLQERCELCHATRRASDLRCERCHDPNTRNEYRVDAHAAFGLLGAPLPPVTTASRDRAAVTELRCADCHDDHRGRAFKPAAVDDRQCTRCHRTDTASLGKHVEFAIVRAKATPMRGLKITHERHVLEALAVILKKKAADLTAAEKDAGLKGDLLQQTCQSCHVRTADQRNFEPISFPQHCAACHEKDGSVGATDPFPATDVVPAEKAPFVWAPAAAQQLTARRDKLSKATLSHRDPWVLFNLAKIRRELDPAASLAERAVLLTRLDAPGKARSALLSRLSVSEVELRRQEVAQQIESQSRRLSLPSGADKDRQALLEGFKTFDAGGAVGALVDPSARDAVVRGITRIGTEPITPLAPSEVPWRRAELLSALDAARERAETAGNVVLIRRIDDARRRALALKPGTAGTGDLKRLLAERRLEEERLADELAFRIAAAGAQEIPPVSSGDRRLDLPEAEVRYRLKALTTADSFAARDLDATARASRLATVEALTLSCKKCHEMGVSALQPLSIDLPVMPRSFFDHKPHVRVASCGTCHGQSGKGVTASKSAQDVLVPGVDNCKGCHKPSETRADCATCHRFHPPNMPARPEARMPSTNLVDGDSAPPESRPRRGSEPPPSGGEPPRVSLLTQSSHGEAIR
ncbi:MAG: cytochrome c3 family protein [Thermoanaerobaculia bacterium]